MLASAEGRRLLPSSRRGASTLQGAEEKHADDLIEENLSETDMVDSNHRSLAAGGNLKATHRRATASSPSEHRVVSLPGLTTADAKKLSHYAGVLEVDEKKGSNIFYWLFEKPTAPEAAPLVVWLNGGPGCSSMDGLWLEHGPFRLEGEGEPDIKINPYSWHNAANMLYVDQPVGTGFSYTARKDGYATSDQAVNEAFYSFLEAFFKLHGKAYTTTDADGRRRTRPFMFSGESHAGHYIPNMVQHILERNAALKEGDGGLHIDVQAAALGNPWIAPAYQYDASEMAHGLGLITRGQMYSLKEMNKRCLAGLKTGKLRQGVCFDLLDMVLDAAAAPGGDKMLMYDARKYVKHSSSFPPGHEKTERYLNKPAVKTALHVAHVTQKFQECTDPPYNALAHQDGLSAAPALIAALEGGVRVLVFSGQYDLVCHHLGTEALLADLEWSGKEGWNKASQGVWQVEHTPAGYITQYQNLQSLVVLDSGHMVPMDQPARALDLFTRFVGNQPFAAGTARLGVSSVLPDDVCPPGVHRRTDASSDSLNGDAWENVGGYLGATLSAVNGAGPAAASASLNDPHGYSQTAFLSSALTIGAVLLLAGLFLALRVCRSSPGKK